MMDGLVDPALRILGADLAWDLRRGTISSAGLQAALFWLDPSLLWMLAPLAEEVGIPLYRLLIAHNANLGADEDYRGLIAGAEFTQGFRRWADVVAASGWGRFELTHFDRRTCEARVVVHDPWELAMQRQLPAPKRWGCPFAQGKLIGLLFHGFGATVWAEEETADDGSRAWFTLARSNRTIARELAVLRAARQGDQRREVARLLALRTGELAAGHAEPRALAARQEGQIQRLSTPILRVAEATLAVPIVGVMTPQRGAEVMHQLLRTIAELRARVVVIDVSGTAEVDAATVELCGRVVREAAPLGVACVICGVRPGVQLEVAGARVFVDMAAALAAVLDAARRVGDQ
jgi:rsbT co-antagonist protein RsbR